MTMIAPDLLAEHLIPLVQTAAKIPSRPSLRTIWRWAMQGSKGRKLETVLIGGSRYTSEEAVKRFLSPVLSTRIVVSRQNDDRMAAILRAERELEEAGLGST